MNVGSKVPFAYTDSFFVKTIYNGTEYKYLCYIDASQLGAISLLETSSTTKGNGTEIIVPIKSSMDKAKFENAIIRQLSYFIGKFKYKNLNIPENSVIFEDETCIILKNPSHRGLHIVLGNVCYPIDHSYYSDYSDSHCGVALKFSIGEIQPTISRESIYWNEKVKAAVMARKLQAQKSIRTIIQAELAGEKDYASWYSMVINNQTRTFPAQWHFSGMKDKTCFKSSAGKELKINRDLTKWFAGHNFRKVLPFGASFRRSSKTSANNVYTTAGCNYYDLKEYTTKEIPIYRIDSTLSARKCKYLFKTNPKGFIVVNHLGIEGLGKALQSDLQDHYDETVEWFEKLPSFDEVVVPDGEFEDIDNGTDKEAYKKLVKQRKLEGKFTAKKLTITPSYERDLEKNFSYKLYESKFEDHQKDLIIYGFQEDHPSLLKVAGMLTYSMHFNKRHDELTNFSILKIGLNYTKQFEQMPNAFHVKEVLAMKTPLNAHFADIVTAHKYEEDLPRFSVLDYLEGDYEPLKVKFRALRAFINENTLNRPWHRIEIFLEFQALCEEHKVLNTKVVADFEEVKNFVEAAPLLEFVNFKKESTQAIDNYIKACKAGKITV